VFQKWVLWQIFGRKRDKVTGHWRRLHNEELSDMYCSPDIIRGCESGKMGGAGHVVGGGGGGQERCRYGFGEEN
jgi:hypothetical protein